jgi:hypothetical protein
MTLLSDSPAPGRSTAARWGLGRAGRLVMRLRHPNDRVAVRFPASGAKPQAGSPPPPTAEQIFATAVALRRVGDAARRQCGLDGGEDRALRIKAKDSDVYRVMGNVAVGTGITARAPHRSVRAAFPHTALASGKNGKSLPTSRRRSSACYTLTRHSVRNVRC